MLPAGNRLRRRDEFATAIRRGRRVGRRSLVAYLYSQSMHPAPHGTGASDEPAGTEPRAGFVVSKAVGKATVRNMVKRRLRHLVRPRLERLPAGSVLVVRALPPAAAMSSRELGTDLDAALRRLAPGVNPGTNPGSNGARTSGGSRT